MADANATRASQAGKTVTTSDGYIIVYDENGFGRKSVSPSGETKYYDSLGNQTKTPYNGPTSTTQQSVDTEGIAAVAAEQNRLNPQTTTAQDQANIDALNRIEANKANSSSVQPQSGVDKEGIAALAAEQEKISPRVTTAEEQANIDAIARIEANRNNPNPPQTPQEAVASVTQAMGPNEQLTAQGIPAGREMGVAFDDEGNLKPGWALDSTGQYYTQTDPSYVDKATVDQASADRKAYQNSQAFDANGNLKEGYTYDEFGTPVKSSTSDQKTVSGDPSVKADHGPAYDDEGNLMPGYSLDENNNPVWMGAGYNDKTGKTVEPIKDDPSVKVDHGPAYDDEGNLMPGWSLDENNNPVWMGAGYNDKTGQFIKDKNASDAKGIVADKKPTLVKNDFKQKPDWRVRLSLAPSANYLYKAAKDSTHILFPLVETDGVIFPYTPQIQINYTSNYDGTDLAHTNYKMYQYKNSEVGAIQITAMFTAQDSKEASYLLAVMHFFRSATKMFYGQDNNPKAGTPPPLLYLNGYGAYQFDNHPLALTSFNMSLPDDVDYIRAGSTSTYTMTTTEKAKSGSGGILDMIKNRLTGSKLKKGGAKDEPVFSKLGSQEDTYVPSKIQMTLNCLPIVTRNDISNNFSLEQYASGQLLRGSKRQTGGGGIW